ncbi:RNA pseudouridine synthase domain containing 1 [Homo sapiens]|uniref:RNA pseudouridine synthase domain containing 1 n=1 Tax=Homo sapiens TaxID=9606 RepID=H3BU91_HUMAN|nr:RNA pseudouridine synthase domain containing 1 [Homo sapiens]KAI4052687.1 RNA pseudouridine synthase domain containing 1 [Homo sapiens]
MEPGSVENLSIVYRSRDFLVVNKHWDVRIDSKAWRETLTLQKQLRYRFPELADPDTCYGFRFCHQLDFSTSGALCVALNKAAAGSAYRCFKERRVTKAYLALVRPAAGAHPGEPGNHQPCHWQEQHGGPGPHHVHRGLAGL